MDQQTFEDAAAGPASLVLFEAGAIDDSFDASTSDDPFAGDIYTDDSQASTMEVICGQQVGVSLPRSFASSMLERCEDVDDHSLLVSGFQRDAETPLTTEVEAMRRSEFYVAKQPIEQPQFAAVQVQLESNL